MDRNEQYKKNTKEERLKNTKEREREKNPAKINLLHVPAVNHLMPMLWNHFSDYRQ